MKDTLLGKDELLEKLRHNRDGHKTTYDKAVAVYRDRLAEILESQLERARKGKDVDHFALSRLPVPENHVEDYDVAIEMLEMDHRDEVLLSWEDYRRYVRDEWEWRRAWIANTQSYLAD